MKYFLLAIGLVLFYGIGRSQQQFDEYVTVQTVKGKLLVNDELDQSVTSYLQKDGSLVSFTKQALPSTARKLCSLPEVVKCYFGLVNSVEKRGTLDNWDYKKIDGYLAVMIHGRINVPERGETEVQMLGIYFNQTLYLINIFCNSKKIKRARKMAEKLMESVHIHDQDKKIRQLDKC